MALTGGGGVMHRGGQQKGTPATRPRAKGAHDHGDELCARNRRMAARRDG
jgi:hypothetical protein